MLDRNGTVKWTFNAGVIIKVGKDLRNDGGTESTARKCVTT